MSHLELRSVSKSFGSVEVVHDLSLSVEEGSFIVVVGPSGCGKSTALRMIAGLEGVSSGSIFIAGREVTSLEPMDRNIAMVFQNYALYPHMTAFANIAYGLKIAGFDRVEIERRVSEAAHLLGLQDYLERRPRELSGGQRQRVAMGRAIVRDAEIFLFDEPLSNLDAKLRDGMREELKKLHERLGKTFIYVTHDQIEAMTLADRIVLMRSGIVEQEGPPLSLFMEPRNLFVASFLGSPSINLVPVRIEGGDLVLSSGGRRVRLGAGIAERLGGYDGLVWGIRPEHFRLARVGGEVIGDCEDDDGVIIEGIIDIHQPTGSRTYIGVDFGGDRLTIEVNARPVLSVGDRVGLVPLMGGAHFFEASGERVVLG